MVQDGNADDPLTYPVPHGQSWVLDDAPPSPLYFCSVRWWWMALPVINPLTSAVPHAQSRVLADTHLPRVGYWLTWLTLISPMPHGQSRVLADTHFPRAAWPESGTG